MQMVQSCGQGPREETEDGPGQDTLRWARPLGGATPPGPQVPKGQTASPLVPIWQRARTPPYTECRHMAEEDGAPRSPPPEVLQL